MQDRQNINPLHGDCDWTYNRLRFVALALIWKGYSKLPTTNEGKALVVIASPLIRFYQSRSWISRFKTDCRTWAKAVCLQMPVLLLLTDRILTQVIVVLPTLSIEFSTARKPRSPRGAAQS